jgi:cob(I)alamin adenosyltransferase
MANRLSKIVTKTGDDGSTGLSDNIRVSKASEIIEAIGTVDELNSAIGLARVICNNNDLDGELKQLQHDLFNVGGDLCLTGSTLINSQHISDLEESLEKYNAQLSPLTNFILPTGSEITARLHMARSICRRAERTLVKAKDLNEFNPLLLIFVNRLSDWLFVVARITDETDEVLWC